jgi:hypothetical protein
MKGYIKGKTIILNEPLPADINEDEEIEIIIISRKKKYNFPTFKLGIKDEALNREAIYERD